MDANPVTLPNNSHSVAAEFFGGRQQLTPHQQSLATVNSQLLNVDEDVVKHG